MSLTLTLAKRLFMKSVRLSVRARSITLSSSICTLPGYSLRDWPTPPGSGVCPITSTGDRERSALAAVVPSARTPRTSTSPTRTQIASAPGATRRGFVVARRRNHAGRPWLALLQCGGDSDMAALFRDVGGGEPPVILQVGPGSLVQQESDRVQMSLPSRPHQGREL